MVTVVVGGGTSGSVVAARLSEDGRRHVVLLEAGPDHTSYPPEVRDPAREYEAILGSLIGVQSSVHVGAASSPTLLYRGEVLGGTSAVNFMATVRGQPDDYDGWAALGCDGWGWQDVLPAFRRAEHDLDLGDEPLHGGDGPLTVRRWPEPTWARCHRALFDGARELGASPSHDINDASTLPGIGVFPGSIQPDSGERLTVSQAYLTDEVRRRPNLEVRCGAPVARVLVDDGRVVGVELRSGVEVPADEVIVCAGAIESPKLLQLSGIGPAHVLASAGIDVVVDLPGVGANLQDHVGLGCVYHHPDDEVLVGSPAKTVWIGSTGAGRGVDFHILACPISSAPGAGTLFQLFVFHLLPRSRGSVRITSSDPAAMPTVEMPLLVDGADLDDLAAVVALVAAWEGTDAFTALGATRLSPAGSLPSEVGRDALLALLDTSTFSYFHHAGTCRMGPSDDPHAVLDSELRVRGVEGLRVVDASAMPTIVRGNTYLGCVMLAEHVTGRMLAAAGGPPGSL